MKVGDLVRWKEKAFNSLYPDDLGVIVEVQDERLARIYWLRASRDFVSMNTDDIQWPLNCMELVEQ